MQGKRRKQDWVRELPEFSSNETRDGVLVRIRCMEISGPSDEPGGRVSSPRYEVFMEARGCSAIADVLPEQGLELSSRIDELVSVFVDSILLQASLRPPA